MKREEICFLLILLILLLLPVYAAFAHESGWEKVLDDKYVRCIAMAPTEPIIYVGTVNKGIYRSENSGSMWKRIGKGIPLLESIYSIAINPKDTEIIYAGTEGGVYKSADGGISFSKLDLNETVFTTALNPINPQIVYAGRYKSTDGGKRWKKMLSSFEQTPACLVINPNHPEVLYAITFTDVTRFAAHTFRSIDSGENWEKISDELIYQLVVDPVHTDTLYACGREGVYKSTDGGDSWRLMNKGMRVSKGDMVYRVLIDPVNPMVIYAGVIGSLNAVYISEDGGSNWRQLGKEFEKIINALAINPSDPNYLYVGAGIHGGGVWRLELPPRKPYHSVMPFGKLATTWGKIKDF